jgi:hypothetical protein
VAWHVDLQVTDGELFGGIGVDSAQSGAQPRHQLLGLGRLDHIVVGAGFQAQHHVDGVALRGEHHDRDIGLGADRLAHVDAAHARQHQVQQHQVGLQLAQRGHYLGALADHRGLEARLT